MTRLTALLVLLVTASCGPLNRGSPVRGAVDLAIDKIRGVEEEEAPLVTPELVNADEILFVTLRRQGALIPMTKATTVGDVDTWVSGGGATLALENGVLVASRGLGFDLSGVDPIGTVAAIRAGGGSSQRTHGFLNNLDQIDTFSMSCQVSDVGEEEVELPRGPMTLNKFEESCRGQRLVFKNEYWASEEGEIVRSLQMLSPQLGFVLLEKA